MTSPSHNKNQISYYVHIKYCEPQTDISCINADYRRMTPREVPHMTRGAAWDHLQAMLGVDRLFV